MALRIVDIIAYKKQNSNLRLQLRIDKVRENIIRTIASSVRYQVLDEERK